MWDSSSTINLVRGFWNLEQKLIYRPREAYPVSEKLMQMSEVVNLVLNEKMQWEWKISETQRIEPPRCRRGDDFSNLEEFSWLPNEMEDIKLFEMAGGSPILRVPWP